MSIGFSRLGTLTARQIASALQSDGFTLDRQRGRHRHYAHPDGRRVTLSFHHGSDTFRPGTLRSIISLQACWTEEGLRRLGLLPKS
jgi:predicted RNA binding protein YcfA (HicA-like mRNA interferase family)